jgi:ribosome-binding factor A
MNESTRQKKIQNQIQQDLAEIFQSEARISLPGTIISVTKVRVTSDLMDARVYLSAFPLKSKDEFMEFVEENASHFKNLLGQRIRHQMRRVPNIDYAYDDSHEYADDIDKALKGKGENPIEDPNFLKRRKR